ncbi:MAG TPA: BadF/BadG/BcrA/BcrD ATPase family protein [Bryobacteraceae bacterium]|jgi:N-acetylglucosamine kinase-like BadF-type ATPase|nr:BadF/BadG/BcrA/BcrD ATPase family protein [Bryobacteraceae bacterium]
MKLFLGVDGGQSSTTALIGDEQGRILGRGVGGPCNHATAAEGRAKLQRAVSESLAAACARANVDCATAVFEAACFGMSGGPDDKQAILAGIIRTGHLIVTHDAAIALSGATASGQGVVVIAGTGSIAFARDTAGRTARAGGWGYVFGDEGGAFDIVRHALRAALRMEEGWGPSTALRQALIEATASESANQVLHLFYTPDWPRSRVAALAALVDTAAGEGDGVALRILENAAQELALLAASVRLSLWRTGDPVDMAYIGGVFASRRLLERFRMLVEFEAGNRCHAPLRDPAEGALREALRAAGVEAP